MEPPKISVLDDLVPNGVFLILNPSPPLYQKGYNKSPQNNHMKPLEILICKQSPSLSDVSLFCGQPHSTKNSTDLIIIIDDPFRQIIKGHEVRRNNGQN